MRRTLYFLGLTMAGTACSDLAPEPVVAPTLSIELGQDQTGEVARILTNPAWISVSTDQGPVAGVIVTLTVRSGNGFIVIPARASAVGDGSAIDELTARDGIAEFFLGMSDGVGPHEFVATADHPLMRPTELVVRATAVAGPVANVLLGGDGQTGVGGDFLPTELTVTLTDQFGNPRADETVTWMVTAGGGSVADSTSTTDGDGVAVMQWRLGASGPQTLDVTVDPLGDFEFTATAQ